ncbi:MAG: recombinase family protein, partial [Hyphomicrobium sp.]
MDTQVQKLQAAGCEKIFEEKKSGASKSERHELKTALAYMREGDQFVVTRLD